MKRASRSSLRRRVKEELELERKFDALYEQERREKAKPEQPQQRLASVQARQTDTPDTLLWWTGGAFNEYIPLSEYGTPQRQRDLQAFAVLAPLILNAEAAVIKKVQSLEFEVSAGRNTAYRWRDIINELEDGDGWNLFVARWVRGFLESDIGGVAEIIRAAPTWAATETGALTDRGLEAMRKGEDAVWPIVNAKTLDSAHCWVTNSREFPLCYTNPYTNRKHYLRNYNFMRIVDMPAPGKQIGVCAVSRAVQAAQLDRYIIKYFFEKLSENPGSGIVFANASDTQIKTALKAAQSEREARGVAFYKGLIFIPVLNPEGTFSAEFINFSGLPDGFSHSETYNVLKEIVAASFGLDVLELGSIPGNNLGTAAQATVASVKAEGKVVGALIAQIEREFRYKFLPSSVEFAFQRQDIAEETAIAAMHGLYIENALKYSQIAGANLATQYLVDAGVIPPEYVETDITDEEHISDTSARKKMQTIKPERGDLKELSDEDAEITDEDVERALRGWREMLSDTPFSDLLDAQAVE